MFEDDFSGKEINRDIWQIHTYIPTYLDDFGDNEFVSYEDNIENAYVTDGTLRLTPTIRPTTRNTNTLGDLDLSAK